MALTGKYYHNWPIYDFEKKPVALIPLSKEECEQLYRLSLPNGIYAIRFEDDTISSFVLIYQNPRHINHGYAGIYFKNNHEYHVILNVKVLACLCKLGLREESEFKEHKDDEDFTPSFKPYDTDSLSCQKVTFPIPSLEDATRFMAEHSLPRRETFKVTDRQEY